MPGLSQIYKIIKSRTFPNACLESMFWKVLSVLKKSITLEVKLSNKCKNGHKKFLTHQDLLKFEEKPFRLVGFPISFKDLHEIFTCEKFFFTIYEFINVS
jgi:hypothetical protein